MFFKVKNIIKETVKAELVETYKFGLLWIPKSAILSYNYDLTKIEVKKWFLNKIELRRMGINDFKININKDLIDD